MDTAIRGVSHVNLVVTDLDVARNFYGEKLGLEELHRPAELGAGLWFAIGDVQLHLSAMETMPPRAAPGLPHLGLHIPTEALVKTVERLGAAGVDFTGEIRTRTTEGRTWSNVFCHDPDGNAIELTDL